MHARYWAAAILAATLISGAVRAAEDESQADIEKQLSEARQKLEAAAHEVAELSTQLGKPLVDRLMLMGEGPTHALIGVQLDSSDVKDGAHVGAVSPGGPAAEAGVRAGDVIVSELDLAEQLRKRPDTVATALNLLLNEQKVQRATLSGYWKLHV